MQPLTTMAIIGVTMIHFSLVAGMTEMAAQEHTMTTAHIDIPRSIKAEHDAIHSALEQATRASGQVGAAARALATVLHPHFVREEQIALPPLAMLKPLSAGELPADAAEALAMSDSLRSELPRMLKEHEAIRAAVQTLRAAAQAEHAEEVVELADELALHARTEEEVMYPAAVLVGDLIRTRLRAK